MKLTQPVLLQSFEDEFKLPDGETPRTPTEPGTILYKPKSEGEQVDKKEQTTY